MPVKIQISAEDSPVGEWLAALTLVIACTAFALVLRFGPAPATDRARVEAPSVGSEIHASAASVDR